MMNELPKLSPIKASWINKFLNNKDTIKALFKRYGSPINLHYLPSFDENIQLFKEVFKKHNIKYKIFYARKANKTQFLIKRAGKNGIGVDTASYNELKQCLSSGLAAEDLVLTAAIKNKKLLELAVENNVLIILDNWDECRLLQNIATQHQKKAKVGFRVSGFIFEDKKLYSRFGFDIDTICETIQETKTNASLENLEYCGLHFHLDGYSIEQRGEAIFQSLEIIKSLEQDNFKTSFLDIGGGILVNYLKQEDQWKNFQKELKKSLLNKSSEITFNNNGLGFRKREGKIEGKLETYPYFNSISKENFLDSLLDYKNKEKLSVAKCLQAQNIQLRIEPGRSLLDQVGITMAKVAFRKIDAKNNLLIGLEMNMSQMSSSSADFLLDPFLIFSNEKNEKPRVEAYFVGAYCLERDVLLKRKITLPQMPEMGDIVVFLNTAGYMMHFFETEAHLFELSKNLAIASKTDLDTASFKEDL